MNTMLELDVIVVGAGIAGIATALSLQRAGHRVTVLESHPSPRTSKGGIKCPPNMSRILDEWGLGPLLKEKGVPYERLVWYDGDTGNVLGFVPIHAEFLAEITAGFYMLSHHTLHTALLELALAQGVKIRYSSAVIQIDLSAPAVQLEGGWELTADLIVGADGATSYVRTAMTGELDGQTEGQDFVNVGLSIPVESIGKENIPSLKSDHEVGMWFGSGYYAGMHLLDAEQLVSVYMCEPSVDGECREEDWSEHPFSNFKLSDGMTFEPRLKKVLSHATTYTRMIRRRRPLLDSFTDELGKCVLVGDAAHPLDPFGTLSTALGIEDAKVLGVLLSHIQRKDQLPHLLSAYDELRVPRCHENQTWGIYKREQFTLPKGELQRQRDEKWKASSTLSEAAWETLDYEGFWKVFGAEMSQYIYHSHEAVEDWWTKWGAVLLRERGEEPPPSPTRVRIERIEENRDADKMYGEIGLAV
ncbi:hypothetical protein DL96DRAFT_270612 [Flagelloscypha sp. PMI_526]|nr:hypothetical protein DL96DRAFT_270612 [Flagelloscypha sp. PMI_526]